MRTGALDGLEHATVSGLPCFKPKHHCVGPGIDRSRSHGDSGLLYAKRADHDPSRLPRVSLSVPPKTLSCVTRAVEHLPAWQIPAFEPEHLHQPASGCEGCETVPKGQVIADCPSDGHGELAHWQERDVAFIALNGYKLRRLHF